MDDLAFSQIFPSGSQDINNWAIAKSDLPGLVANSSNSPGELFVSLCLAFWYQNQPRILTDGGDVITTDQGDEIFCDAMDLYADIQTIYWQLTFQNINNQVFKYDSLVVFSYATFTNG